MMTLQQNPNAGACLVKYAGDLLEISVNGMPSGAVGAFVRTDFGDMREVRRRIVENVDAGHVSSGNCWHDVRMTRDDDGFRAVFPLSYVGVFEFKAYVVCEDGRREWVPGENLHVKVEPSISAAHNAIYNAFIRQFGPNISGGGRNPDAANAENFLSECGYTVIPPSGTFASFRDKLDCIFNKLHFRIVMFLPVHPVPSSYGRMGRFGSAFAPLDFYTVDASMAVFDEHDTPLGQFCKVIDDIHSRHGLVFIDLPVDHTGWASSMQTLHPEWFRKKADGSFECPGAWGVTWADLCKLDFTSHALWREMSEVLLHWCRLGVDGFRCDAGYMVPADAWEYMTARTRLQYPDTLFLLEGLGGDIGITERLLKTGSMNWAYSESFQQFGYAAEHDYLRHSLDLSSRAGLLVNFAETHDNSRLAAVSAQWAVLRTASAALLAPAGAFGMANGVEWLATEKIDVHNDSSLNWDAQENIVGWIAALNRLLAYHPCFGAHAELVIPESFRGDSLSLLRKSSCNEILVLVNPDCGRECDVSWSANEFACGERAFDLLAGAAVHIKCIDGICQMTLPPGMSVCLSKTPFNLEQGGLSPIIHEQEARLCVMRLLMAAGADIKAEQATGVAMLMGNDIRAFIHWLEKLRLHMTEWRIGRDSRRIVMLPVGNVLHLTGDKYFEAELKKDGVTIGKVRGLACGNGYSAFFTEAIELRGNDAVSVQVREYSNGVAELQNGSLMVLDSDDGCLVHTRLQSVQIRDVDCGLCTNSMGSYSMARAAWGRLGSKYDALLAANLAKSYPSDRIAMLLRNRVWLRFRDFSTELDIIQQRFFEASYDNSLAWEFKVECGLGLLVSLRVIWQLDSGSNSGRMVFELDDCGALKRDFAGDALQIIIRPDVDCRSVHSVTKAYSVEGHWAENIHCVDDCGFAFDPAGNGGLCMEMSGGTFHKNVEWTYEQSIPVDQERGLEHSMDIMSPGYFEFVFNGAGRAVIHAAVGEGTCVAMPVRSVNYGPMSLEESLRLGIMHFIVTRDKHKSIMAGYPWFLDWGRDTLICMRGCISAGMFDMARDCICLFATFEENGTLPNMIRGKDTSDRDTSDAPLWLYVAVEDYIKAKGANDILDMNCGDRKLLAILEQLAMALWNGASNGVRADHLSGLLYSRPHFTWMDTNYPAGTPRSGYPVEIQALWINALAFLNRYSNDKAWGDMLRLARESFMRLFSRKDGRGLCDCLHSTEFLPAMQAVPDDACRPNQLIAITLGALEDHETAESILEACAGLLIPGGIRSLDDAPVSLPLPIVDNGNALNDPYHPYWGHYSGFEDSRRKPAYHNGTAWGWQMPLFCEADFMLHGHDSRLNDIALLSSSAKAMEHGCLGFIPEIYDGDAPHTQKGCLAQAWSMTEFYRVWKLIRG